MIGSAAAAAAAVFHLAFSVNVPCNAAPGAVVASISVRNSNGNPITLALAGDVADFAVSGASVVVGPNGILPAHCGSSRQVTVTATQN